MQYIIVSCISHQYKPCMMFVARAKAVLRRLRPIFIHRSVVLGQFVSFKWTNDRYTYSRYWPCCIFGASCACVALCNARCEQKIPEGEGASQLDDDHSVAIGGKRTNLPTYTFDEVQKHMGSNESATWVIYKRGVYDISKFIKSHPGGTKILLAAGNSIEPFWQLYAAHNHAQVYKLLETMRIGNLREEDVAMLDAERKARYTEGPYSIDPMRHPALRVNSRMPFNAEPPSELLMESFILPNDLFFVRNHLPVPEVDIDNFTLKISGLGDDKDIEFTLDDLKKNFEHHTVTTTVQCAGNRRAEMSAVKQVNGLSWGTSAISTASWTGVLLSDVLASISITDEDWRNGQCECKAGENMEVCNECNAAIQHVQFEGLDADIEGNCYGASIPISTALDPRKDVLLAFEMNGETIPRDHGYPLRVIVPGTVGARSVKFLHRIVLSSEESPSFWQQRDYKGFPPNLDYAQDDVWKYAGASIQELPVQSAITEPKDGFVCVVDNASDSSILTVKGYAWSGGGRNIIRVDVSADGGKTWTPAKLHKSGKRQKYNRAWAWTPWEIDIGVPPGSQKLDIICKAIDVSYNVQPDTIAPIWNMRGVLNNAWHRIHVLVAKSDEDDTVDDE